jgi:hypothetical protein
MAALPVRENHDARTKPAQHGGDLEAIFLGILHVAVRQIEGFAMGDAEDIRGGFRLGGSLFGGTPSASLAAREIEDARAPTQRLLDEKRPAAGLLDVIAMRSDGKDVEQTCFGGV